MEELSRRHGLGEQSASIAQFAQPALAFGLREGKRSKSRFGGAPLLPPGFVWPSYVPRPKLTPEEAAHLGLSSIPEQVGPQPLDFLLQLDLAELLPFDVARALPRSGLLTFFYDTVGQPWGFDPDDRGGFRVVLVETEPLVETLPLRKPPFAARALHFWPSMTVPHIGSRAYDALEARVELPDSYFDFCAELENEGYGEGAGRHRLFGHSANVQGDMQLEAQLVSNGLYCGDASGHQDARREELESGADDWLLLLQLDSDSTADMMWGDTGTLFFWIRKSDLAAARFDNCWVVLQCG